MGDETRDPFSGADELRALAEVRAALEGVEQEQGRVVHELRRLRARLDGLQGALRDGALVLSFDADGALQEATGVVDARLDLTPDKIASLFDEVFGADGRASIDDANRVVIEDATGLAAVSRCILSAGGDAVPHLWIHVPRWDETGELAGVDAIGLPSVPALAEEAASAEAAEDPFEALLEQVSRRLLRDIGQRSIERAIEALGDFVSADRVVINRYDEEARKFSIMASWLGSGVKPLAAEQEGIAISELPWAYSQLSAGELVVVSRDDLPADAEAEGEVYAAGDVAASMLVPLVSGGELFGYVAIQALKPSRWSTADRGRARRFAMVLTSALAHGETVAQLNEARQQKEAASAAALEAESQRQRAADEAEAVRRRADTATAERDAARDRLAGLERDLQQAREAETSARRAAEESDAKRAELERQASAATEALDAAREEAETAREELSRLREEAQRSQRRAEDTAADALVVRQQLDEEHRKAEEALRDAADARAELRRLRETPRAAQAEQPHDADATVPVKTPHLPAVVPPADEAEDESPAADTTAQRSGFDPDATLEMAALEVESTQGGARSASGELPRAVGLDELLQRTQAGGGRGRAADALADETVEVDLPPFLEEQLAEGPEDAAARADDVARDVEAARQLARSVAGKDSDGDAGVEEVDQEQLDERDDRHDEPPTEEVAVEADEPDSDEFGTDDVETPEIDDELADMEKSPEGAVLPEEVAWERRADEAARPTPAGGGLPGIDIALGLRDVGGNVELYRNLLRKFRQDYLGAAAKIDHAIGKGNIEVAHLLLHAIKGVSGVLGATRLRDSADDLETKLIGRDKESTRAGVDVFTSALDEVLASIATLEAGADPFAEVHAPSGEAHVSDPLVLRSYLSGLRQHLLAERPRQCQLVMREITARNWPADFNARVKDLAGFVQAENFPAARQSFDELMKQFGG